MNWAAGARHLHFCSKSVLRFYGGEVEDMHSVLRYGYKLPDAKKFNDFGVGIHFSTNATKAALSTSDNVNQLLVSEVCISSQICGNYRPLPVPCPDFAACFAPGPALSPDPATSLAPVPAALLAHLLA